ncbi:uncharacterized protein MONOS_15419 [Monocercomonoides exilis]|uniref:uncharacterized protein n=1 Tax=Monocercomonoides exilis TaxID=2049356 RepID=UPI003559A6E7|nr:hypothetical protein MONOS_15419 [Monocercomonoides exilis]
MKAGKKTHTKPEKIFIVWKTLFHLFPSLENGELSQLVDLSDPNVDVVAAQQSSLRSAPSSSSSAKEFRRRRSEEKKVTGDDKPSSAPAIDPSDASAVAASYTSAGAMDDIERRLRIVVPEAAGVYGRHMPLSLQQLLSPRALQTLRMICCGSAGGAVWGCSSVGTKSGSKRIFAAPDANAFPSIYDLFDPSLQIWRSQQSRRVEVKLDDEMMGRGIEVREVDKRMDAVWLRMEDMVLLPEEIVLVVLEEREEAEEGDVNEVKGGYPAAHREFVERIKENRGKLEEAMAPLVVEALGMSGLRFVKAETWTEIFFREAPFTNAEQCFHFACLLCNIGIHEK